MNTHGAKWIRPAKRAAIYRRDGNKCAYCGVERLRLGHPVKEGVTYAATFTLDHLIPRELGGTNVASNLVSACFRCNSARQDKSLRTWFKALRKAGVNTDAIGRRIRRLVRKPLSIPLGRR